MTRSPINTKLNSLAKVGIAFSQAAKVILGFSALLSVVLATDYPAYNVLIFAGQCGERALAQYAHKHFGDGLELLSYSILAASACIFIIPIRITMLKADNEYIIEKAAILYNSIPINVMIIVFFVVSITFAYFGWNSASSFFDGSNPSNILRFGECGTSLPSIN